MAASFSRTVKIVTGVHVVAIVALFATGWLRSCRQPKKEEMIHMEFLVAVPPAPAAPVVNDIPNPVAPPKKPSKRPTKTPRKKDPIKISRKPAVNPNFKKPQVKPLSPEEIQRMLEKGAKPSDRTVIPDDDSIHFAMVRQAFHDAWTQPSAVEAGDAVVEAEIRFSADGRVVSARVKKRSGIEAMDVSVAKALTYVKRVSGLTRDFLTRHDTITISFRVE